MVLTAALVAAGWGMVWWAPELSGAVGDMAEATNLLWLTVLCGIAVVVALVTVFLYRNRKRQISILAANFLLLAGCFGFAVYICWIADKVAPFAPPVIAISLLTNWLAFRGVTHDELLVRSADRIR